MPDASCPGCVHTIVYDPAARLLTSNSLASPGERSSLVAIALPELSLICMSCEVLPVFTSQNTTLPCATVMGELVPGSNLNSVNDTFVEPEGWPPTPPPHAATNEIRATNANATANFLIIP